MSEPFRGNVDALLERERALAAANHDLEAEIARLKPASPADASAKPIPRAPLVIIGLCFVFLVLSGVRVLRGPQGPINAPMAPAPKPH